MAAGGGVGDGLGLVHRGKAAAGVGLEGALKRSALRRYVVLQAVLQFALLRTERARRGEVCAMTHFYVFFLSSYLILSYLRATAKNRLRQSDVEKNHDLLVDTVCAPFSLLARADAGRSRFARLEEKPVLPAHGRARRGQSTRLRGVDCDDC